MEAGFKYPVSPLIGCNYEVLKDIEYRFPVDPDYRGKFRRTKILSWLLHQLARCDRIRYRSMLKGASPDTEPVFIIGHWRSGTTFLHSLLCRVYPAAYATTYQTTFPNNLFAFQPLLKFFMELLLPEKRPTDEMRMHPDLPQEEEIALGHEWFFSFYYWFYFPRHASQLANEFMYLDDPRDAEAKKFQQYYRELMRRCQLNTGGDIFISKNPVNTGRIAALLDAFPDARFIYLKRDPYETIRSSMLFFESLFKGISLQHYEKQQLDRFIIENYARLVKTYLKKKERIPPRHLIEISYENLTRHSKDVLAEVIEELDLHAEADLASAHSLLKENRDFTSRQYQFSDSFIRDVNEKMKDLIEKQGYRKRETCPV